MPSHLLANSETQKCYQNELTFYGDCSKNNLSKIKDGAYVINLDEQKSIGVRWIAWSSFDMWMVIMWHILMDLELNTFQNEFKSLWVIQLLKQIL